LWKRNAEAAAGQSSAERQTTVQAGFMNLRKFSFIAFGLSASVACAADGAWPRNSAADLSIFVTLQRFHISADHCSAMVPELKPEFERRVMEINGRVRDISSSLLASDAFKGMREKAVPTEIVDAFKDSFEDMEHNFQRGDASSTCPKALLNLGEADDASLKLALSGTLTAVQTMIRNLEKQSAHQAVSR
jgi:hypothetical protein